MTDLSKALRGERNGRALLDADKAIWIVQEHEKGKTQQQLADELNVSRATVGSVLTGRTWSHVTGR